METNLNTSGKVELPPNQKRTRGKSRRTPAKVLPTIVDALAGLEPEEIKRVLSAAAIMTGVANFAEKDNGRE